MRFRGGLRSHRPRPGLAESASIKRRFTARSDILTHIGRNRGGVRYNVLAGSK